MYSAISVGLFNLSQDLRTADRKRIDGCSYKVLLIASTRIVCVILRSRLTSVLMSLFRVGMVWEATGLTVDSHITLVSIANLKTDARYRTQLVVNRV